MAKVALIRCESYEYEEVYKAVERGIGLLGGAEKFVKAGEKLLLKPNLLSADPPDRCSTTNPAVFKAVAEIFKGTGVKLSYGDSPAFTSPRPTAVKAGIAPVADELGIPLSDFENGEEIFFEKGIQNKRFVIARGVLEADGIISISKMKTHGFAKMTGSIKNQFGCIPGKLKGEFHVKLPDLENFSRMLVDLCCYLNPRLYIMDGIYAMEGNGPRGGTPKKMNVLLMSADPVALDATVCRMIRLKPELVPTTVAGMKAGLGTYKEDELEIVGDKLEDFITNDFNVAREKLNPFKATGALKYIRNTIVHRPAINEDKCVKCGVCVKMCPVENKAVNWHDGDRTKAPTYKYSRCIRCYCCQELCPESAIFQKVPLVRKAIKGFFK